MRRNFWMTIRIFLIPFFFLTTQAKPKDDLYSKISPGCVEILVGGRLDGSGVIVDAKGLVMTAFHVIKKKSKKIEVYDALFKANIETDEAAALKYLEEGRAIDPENIGLLFSEINFFTKFGKFETMFV